jgi:signal peptidase I
MLIVAIAAALALQMQAPAHNPEFFVVKAENMTPRLNLNQRVEFDLAAYATQPPQVGDIVLIHPPRGAHLERCGSPRHAAPEKLCIAPFGGPDTTVKFVMRVVATAGDRVTFRRGLVLRNGTPERRKNIRRCGDAENGCYYRETITVPARHVYVAGDNRGSSDDSRFWGALPTAQVLGRYVRTAGTCGC